MARIVPSQVVAVIDQLLPDATNPRREQEVRLSIGHSHQLAAIVDLVERLPDELLTLSTQDFATLRVCVTAIRNQIEQWHARGDHVFTRVGGLQGHPVTLLRSLLAKCPDEAPAPGTAGLTFIQDTDLRDSIRLDISGANRDLASGEYKGSTVLAGSALEALLLWKLQEHERSNPGSLQRAGAGVVRQRVLVDPEQWNLHEYIEVAAALNLIHSHSAAQARQATEFRNLIHPGRVQRLGVKCDRGTALAALAAVEFVVRDLTPP